MAQQSRRGRGNPQDEYGPLPDPSQVLSSRIPPQNLEAEVSTLGALMLDPEAISRVADSLSSQDFYRPEYAAVYEAMVTLYAKRVPIDLVTVGDELVRVKLLEMVGGQATLSNLVSAVATASNVAHYANIVREKAMLRRLIHAAAKIGDLGFQEQEQSQTILDQAEQALFSVTQRFLKQNFISVRDILAESFERLDALSRNEGATRGVASGFKHLDNLLGGFQPSDLVILAARPSMGKCVAASTEVIDPSTGALTTIADLVARKAGQVVTLGIDGKLAAATPSSFVSSGIKPTLAVRTALGKSVTGTYVHPVLTGRGWKRLEELTVGDRIAVPRRLPFFGASHMAAHKIAALAYFLSDGNLTNATPRFTNTNPAIVADFTQAMQKFGWYVQVSEQNYAGRAATYSVAVDPEGFRQVREMWSIVAGTAVAHRPSLRRQLTMAGVLTERQYSWWRGESQPSPRMIRHLAQQVPSLPLPALPDGHNPVTAFLREQEIFGKDAHAKTIPASIFGLAEADIAAFLRRLYACDGSAYVATTAAGARQAVIEYTSVSRQLARQVQHLLLRFGIVAKLRDRQIAYAGRRVPAYSVEVRGREHLLGFCEKIGILGKEAAVEAVRQLALATRERGYSGDTLPREIWQEVAARKGKRSWASLGTAGNAYHGGRQNPRRETIADIARTLGDQQLLDYAQADVYWDTVTAVEPAGEQPVFDLTVDDTHNFIANDIVVHNTAFATNVAEYAAVHSKKTVGIFSLEMSKEQLVDRLISSIGRIDSWKLRNGKLNDDDFRKLNEAYGILAEANLFIDDAAGQSVMEIRAKARRLQADAGVDLIIIDYLQLMSAPGFGSDNRVQEVSEISRSLKALAKELNVPIIALSQLSRAVESRPDKRPMLSDLRESGSIEQDADVVIFLYRDDYYNKEEQNNITDVLVRKHRNGPTGDVKVLSRLQYSRFENLDLQHGQAAPA